MKISEKINAFKIQILSHLKQIPGWSWVVGGVIFIIIILIATGKPAGTDSQVAVVERHDVIEQVMLSGRTESGSAVDLGFAESGRVASVYVNEGDEVYRGQVLASLETSDLAADLRDASADLVIARAGLANTKSNLDTVSNEQDALVASAYRNLLSEGLIAVPHSSTNTVTPPTLSGSYVGFEGEYKIIIERQSITSKDFDVRTFNLERTIVVAEKEKPTPLGTHGLYITFPDGIDAYDNTIWYVSLPNKTSDEYLANLNAYQQALSTRDRVVVDARADLSGMSVEASIAQAKVEQAIARVDAISAQIAKRRITAPFSGVVAHVDLQVGEAAVSGGSTGNVSGITLISETDYEVVLKAPEIDVAKLAVGQQATLALDAYGKDVLFPGTIISINPAETIVDGVPVYETHVVFDAPDERIRSGMTATATIITQTRKDVLSIPSHMINMRDGVSFVDVVNDENKAEKRVITTGLRGSDSSVEIMSGLTEGERVQASTVK